MNYRESLGLKERRHDESLEVPVNLSINNIERGVKDGRSLPFHQHYIGGYMRDKRSLCWNFGNLI